MSEPYDKYNKNKNLNNTGAYDFETRYKETKYNDDIAGILKKSNHQSNINIKKRKARKKRIITRLTIVIVALILVLVLAISGIVAVFRGISSLFHRSEEKAQISQLVYSADIAAAGYDYDEAINIIKSFGKKYNKKKELKTAILNYENGKSKLIKYDDNSQIPHISFRTLIYDTSKAFDGDESQYKYDRNMVTVLEFSNILESLYNRGYVLVDIHQIVNVQDGNVTYSDIYLPDGKKPIMISQENVSYYSSLAGNGFASKLIIDENGKPKCEYVDENGHTSTGDFDLVPILESFIEKHPDFSYHGARATLAVTGYDGVFGYRTNSNNDGFQADNAEKAKTVADRLKELGYTIASNSWDYTSYGNNSLSHVQEDANRWESEVKSIVGDTDILIFAGTADISSSGEYKDDNEKLNFLKSKGFSIFCPAGSQHAAVIGNGFLRMERQNISGLSLYYDSEDFSDFFDTDRIVDISRPSAEYSE